LTLFFGMVALVMKFLGKHIASDLVAHYAKQQPSSPSSPTPPGAQI
jgi:hypothetical protein